ncbi:MAG: aspartate/glutamate racemase family protein [Pseudomonadota bacterium]
MKTIGLIGGMSWESTVIYYQMLNRMARERLGGLHSAKLLLWSFDFAEIEKMQAAGDWKAAAKAMVQAGKSIENGGADCIVICTNTMHKLAGDVIDATSIPLIHIADATAGEIEQKKCNRPLLLATRYTMEQDFYKGHLRSAHNVEAVIPDDAGRTVVHDVIYEELCQGVIKPESKAKYLDVVTRAREVDGIDSIIFGCTEVGLLIDQDDFDIPTFDTTELHARAALDFALSE